MSIATMGPTIRRVRIDAVSEDANEVKVSDGSGWQATLNGNVRPKGTTAPAEGEIWLIERIDSHVWILKALEKAGSVDLGAEVNAIIAAEVERQISDKAEQEAQLRAKEAALASGILEGNATVLIQPTPPGEAHQNASTLWIDTTNDLDRPMRWDGDQWVVVVDATAIKAAKAAADAREAADAADSRADAAEAAALAAQQAANNAIGQAEAALAAAAGKGRVIYGDPTTTAGEANSLLIGPGNRLYRWNGDAWVEVPDSLMLLLKDELDALTDEVNQSITDLSTLQNDLVGIHGRLDGKSTIWPLGSSPELSQDDVGDLRLISGGGVEFWDGAKWVPADPRVAAAVNEAAEALGLANTKSTTYYKATAPTTADIEAPETSFRTNDLWLRTTDNRLHRWDGENWIEVKDKAISDLETNLSLALTGIQSQFVAVEGRIDGKATVYVQPTAPEEVSGPEDKGDIWIDTQGNLRIYKVWSGTAWETITDPEALKALEKVSTRTTTYYAADPPPGSVQVPLVTGDLWVRSSDNRLHRWDGDSWTSVDDMRLATHAQAISDIQDDLLIMDGKIDGKAVVYVQPTNPATGSWGEAETGDIWIDTTGTTRVYKVWAGSDWQTITDPVAQQALSQVQTKITTYYATALASPTRPNVPTPTGGFTPGDLWLNSSADNQPYRYDGAAWVLVADSRIASQSSLITGLQTSYSTLAGRVDGKAVIWYQPTAPANLTEADQGDIWVDSDASPKTYKVWSGTAWQDVTDQHSIDTLSKVNGKTTTYFATALTSPTRPNVAVPSGGFTIGDLWVNSADKRTYRFDGSSWVDVTYVDPRVSTLESNLTAVQGQYTTLAGKVDGKAVIWYQPGAPTSLTSADAGDIWVDSDATPKTYKVWSGSAWQDVTDQHSIDALSKVNTKITTYYQATEPTGTAYTTGDLWYDTDDNRTYRWNGSDWLDVTFSDPRITTLESNLTAVQGQYTTLAGKVDSKAVIWYQPSAPTGLGTAETGDIWIDSDANPKTYKVWSGTGWQDVTDQHSIDTLSKVNTKTTTYHASALSAPTRPNVTTPAGGFTTGDLWVNTSDSRTYRWNGTSWVDVTFIDPRVTTLESDLVAAQGSITGLQTAVDGKAVIWYQPSAPTGLTAADAGDIWIDSDANPKKFQSWSGTGWVDIADASAIDALSKVSTKTTTYYSSNQPAVPAGGFTTGDLWYDLDDKKVYRWAGSWVDVTYIDPRVATQAGLISDLQGQYTSLNGKVDGKAVIWYQPTAPTTLTAADQGDIWIDSDAVPKTFKSWSGTGWVDITEATAVEALSKVNTKVTTYYATALTSPTRPNVSTPAGGFTTGDLWVNQSDSNKLFRYDGTSWVEIADARIAALSLSLGNLQGQYTTLAGKVDGKAEIWYQSTDPSVGASPAWGADQTGDIWVNSGASPKTYKVWGGATAKWQDVTDATAIDALSKVGTKVTTYYAVDNGTGRPNITPPAGGFTVGDLWLNQSAGNALRRFDGTSWVFVGLGADAITATARDLGGVVITALGTAPANPKNGDLWIDISNGNVLKRYDGIGWIVYQDADIQAALNDASNAQSTADGKVRLFSQPTAPTGLLPEDEGDIWINTAEDNKIYTWSIGQPTTTVGAVNATNYTPNPAAAGSGSVWSVYRSGGSGVLAVPSSGTFGPVSTFYSVTSIYEGEIGFIVQAAQVSELSGQVANFSVYARSNRNTTFTLRVMAYSSTAPALFHNQTMEMTAGAVTLIEAMGVTLPPDLTYVSVAIGVTSTSEAPGQQVEASAMMITKGLTPAPYFSGDTPDTATNQYSWAGTPHRSISHRRPVTTTLAGYQWVPRPVGNQAVDPGSLVGDDVIQPGTISAELLRAVLILAENRLVAGDENGSATEIDNRGLSIYTTNEDDSRTLTTYLGHEGDQALMLTGQYQEEGASSPSPVTTSIDPTGALSARTINTTEDIRIGGSLLMGAWADRNDLAELDRESIFWDMAWGQWGDPVDVYGLAGSLYSNPSTGPQMLAWGKWNLLFGRFYRVSVASPVLSMSAMSSGTSSGIVRLHKTHVVGLNGNPPAPSTGSETVAVARPFWPATTSTGSSVPTGDLTALLRPNSDVTQAFAVSIQGFNATVSPQNVNFYNWKMYVEDLGPRPVYANGSAYTQRTETVPNPPDPPSPPTKYTTIWTPSIVRQYQGGTQGWGTWNGVQQVDKMGQGRFQPHYLDRHSVARFGGYAVSGGHKGSSIASALSGATVESVKVRLYNYASAYASVSARIGWQTSWTATPSVKKSSAKIAQGESVTTTLPSEINTWVKSNSGNVYITVGPGTTTTRADYAFFHGATGSSSQIMQLIITYTKA